MSGMMKTRGHGSIDDLFADLEHEMMQVMYVNWRGIVSPSMGKGLRNAVEAARDQSERLAEVTKALGVEQLQTLLAASLGTRPEDPKDPVTVTLGGHSWPVAWRADDWGAPEFAVMATQLWGQIAAARAILDDVLRHAERLLQDAEFLRDSEFGDDA